MNEQITPFLQKSWVLPTAVGMSAFSVGGAVGYIVGKVRGINMTVERTAEMLNDVYAELAILKGERAEEPETEVRVITEAKLHSISLVPHDEVVFDVPPVTIIREIADDPDENWDWEAERATRTREEPYILHKDEYMEDDFGHTQSTVSYYVGDDIMTDEHDTPIYGHTAMVGELRFGHGSGDENVVYIRNELLEHDYEVLRIDGRYEVEVLGLEIDEEYREKDLKHSNDPRRFKDWD